MTPAQAAILKVQALVVQRLDSAIHRIKIYSVDNTIGFPNTYPLNSDLSGGQRYPTFEQPGPGHGVQRYTARIELPVGGLIMYLINVYFVTQLPCLDP